MRPTSFPARNAVVNFYATSTFDDSAARDALMEIADDGRCWSAEIIEQPPTEAKTSRNWSIPDDEFRGRQDPSFTRVSVDSFLILFPDTGATSATSFAVAQVSGVSESMVQRLVNCAWQNVQLTLQSSEQLGQLNLYADQVLHDFAELDWLQKLVAHLKVCSLENSLAETATGLITPLRELIRAEAMAFVAADSDSYNGISAGLDFDGAWLADSDALRKTVLPLVRRYGADACKEVVVRNRQVSWNSANQFPDVTGFMLGAVQQGSRLCGWLVGINRGSSSVNYAATVNATHEEDEFSTAEAGLLASAASILATHDHNVSLLKGNIQLSIGIIRALANAVDAKDEYTRGHSDRVARMARQFGIMMNLSKKECQQLLMAGLLHDIGKIGVADDVLQKPGRLTDEEFAAIRQHPVHGFKILEPVTELKFALPGVLHHHEAFDGSGYPDGISGEDIPLVARIIAVVDSYDAMTSNRPYRRGMGFDVAEQKLRDGAGQFWDPDLIDMFLHHRFVFRQICQDNLERANSFDMVDTRELILNEGESESSVFTPSDSMVFGAGTP